MNFIKSILNRYPKVKLFLKKIYKYFLFIISPKIKYIGELIKVSPSDDKYEYFFGYYDKSPWDITDRYLLCLKVKNTYSDVSPHSKADIILIDTQKCNKSYKIGSTNAWNVQQGCMLQWLGPNYSNEIIYNDYCDGKYCSVVRKIIFSDSNITSEAIKTISMPVYAVSSDGKFALSLDFSRLYNLRPGYGYYNLPEATKDVYLPNSTCIWYIDLLNNKSKSLLKYTDFSNFEPRSDMENAIHKVNHIMINPANKRFMVLHRWIKDNKKYTRLITCDITGKNMYNLSDDDMVSHCYWKSNNEILAFENKTGIGNGYYLMKDKTKKFEHLWPFLNEDGHPSYSPNGKYIVTDTYPNKARLSTVKILNEKNNDVIEIAKVFSPFKYDGDTRCDLHPRWNRKGNKICIDAVYEGKRNLYIINFKHK